MIAQSHMVHGLLHEALAEFCVERPGFRFAVEIWQEEYISHWIANRLFDVGFSPQRADHPEIVTELLIRAPLLIMMRSNHRLARSRRINAAQLAEEQIVAVRPGAPLRQHLDAFFASGATIPLIRGETSSAVSACQLTSKGLGITLTDPFVAHLFANDPSVVFRRAMPAREMEYLLATAGATAEVIDRFRAALAARDIVAPAQIIADGNIHRCDAAGKNGKGDAAYLLHLDGVLRAAWKIGATARAGNPGASTPGARWRR